jgi:TonB-dependent outer membrane receptor, SusC/RagA subfamily, signature region
MKRFLLNISIAAASLSIVISCGPTSRVYDSNTPDDQVNIGYGQSDKDDLTYSVSSVKMSESEMMTYTNMFDYLRGRVPGVEVTPDNHITIRGKSSILSSTEPLIMVDGMEVESLDAVSPYDVYSVDVLKDSSSSIYGVRGANGVILITTKGAQQMRQAEIEAKKAEKAAKRAEKAAKKAARKGQVQVEVNVNTSMTL